MKNWLGLIVVLTLWGCGPQDPLQGYPPEIREGLKPEQRPQKPDNPGKNRNAYRIVVNDKNLVNLSEGEEGSVKIYVFFLKPVTKYTLEVANPEVFKDSKLVLEKEQKLEKEYSFKWTPEIGFTGPDPVGSVPLHLKLFVEDEKIEFSEEQVLINVHKRFRVPKVEDIRFRDSKIFEGEQSELYVSVRDEDATSQKPPKVKFTKSVFSDNDADPYLKLENRTYEVATQRWIFTFKFDLRNREVTSDSRTFYATAVAISPFEIESQNDYTSIVVKNKVWPPVVSLSEDFQTNIQQGSSGSFSFSVMDVYKDGRVDVEVKPWDYSQWPGKPTLKCKPVKGAYWLECLFTWNVPINSNLNASYDLELNCKNEDFLRTQTEEVQRKVRINILAPPTTTTTSSTTTTTHAISESPTTTLVDGPGGDQ